MFKRGQLVIVDVDKFCHFYRSKFSGSNYERDLWLKDWISYFNKVTNETRILRTRFQEGDAVFVETLNGKTSWCLNIGVLTPYIEKTFYCLKYHL